MLGGSTFRLPLFTVRYHCTQEHVIMEQSSERMHEYNGCEVCTQWLQAHSPPPPPPNKTPCRASWSM